MWYYMLWIRIRKDRNSGITEPDPKPAPDPYYLSKISKNVREKDQHFIIFNDLLP